MCISPENNVKMSNVTMALVALSRYKEEGLPLLWCSGAAAALSTVNLAMSDFAVFIMLNGRERGKTRLQK